VSTQPIATQGQARVASGPRVLQLANPHMTGDDVRKAQELLLENPFGRFDPGGADGEYGLLTAAAVEQAKWALGFPTGRLNGSFGSLLGGFLAEQKPLPAAYEERRQERLLDASSEPSVRVKIVRWALWGVAHADLISYSNGMSRLAALGAPGSLPLATDCSAFATLCYAWAGAPNPNAAGPYDPGKGGYTGTMLHHCRHIPSGSAKQGDLVVWTPPPQGQHVCIVISRDLDPWLVSHGNDAGPKKVRFSDENAYQSANGHRAVTWLSAFPA